MKSFAEGLWVGNSTDEQRAEVPAVLNVACDLRATREWPEVEYAHVGLIDGPGNPLSGYCAAVMALAALVERHSKVLVCCHEGNSRSPAVALMYMNLTSYSRRTWGTWLSVVRERVDGSIPEPHSAHAVAFDKMPWGLLTRVVG